MDEREPPQPVPYPPPKPDELPTGLRLDAADAASADANMTPEQEVSQLLKAGTK